MKKIIFILMFCCLFDRIYIWWREYHNEHNQFVIWTINNSNNSHIVSFWKSITTNVEYNTDTWLIDTTYSTETNSLTILGVGLLDNKLHYEKYNTYWGGRISIAMDSESDDNIYLLAPVYGAEYYFNDNFSLGGETRLNFAFDKSDEENSVIDISTHLFFRFYN